jgi:hypothetical protein
MPTKSSVSSTEFYSTGTGTTSSNQLPINPIVSTRVPTASDVSNDLGFFPIGQMWIDTNGGYVYFLASISSGSVPHATWTPVAGTSGLAAIYGNQGKAYPTSNAVLVTGESGQFATGASGSTFRIAVSNPLQFPLTASAVGSISASGGNLVRAQASSKDIYSKFGSGLYVGACASGTVTLIYGATTVYTTAITSSSLLRLYRQGVGQSAALGNLMVGTRVAGVLFNINSIQFSNAGAFETGDFSNVFWEIIN